MLDIPNLIAGFILGLIPIIGPSVYRFIRLSQSIERRKYRGMFYLYHWSGKETDIVREKQLVFRLSISGKISVRMPMIAVTGLSYRGFLYNSQNGPCYIDLAGDAHQERVMLVFSNPVNPNFSITSGVFCSVSLDAEPMAWKFIMSREKLNNQRAGELLGSRLLLKKPMIQFKERIPDEFKETA